MDILETSDLSGYALSDGNPDPNAMVLHIENNMRTQAKTIPHTGALFYHIPL